MTIRADISTRAVSGLPLSVAHAAPLQPLAEGFIAPVADRATALFFDEASPVTGARRRLAVEADGAPVHGPLVSTALPLRSGRCRHVVLLGHSAGWLVRQRVVVSLGGVPASVIDPTWLQSPLVDVAAVFEGLTEEGRQRLLRLFLTTGASLLGRGTTGFAEAAAALLALLGVRRIAPLGWCPTGTAARIVSYRLPAGFDAARLGPLVTLAGSTMARIAGSPTIVEEHRDGTLLHVAVTGATPDGALLVATGAEPVALALPGEAGVLPVGRWLAARDAAIRGWCGALLDAAAPRDPLAAAILREIRHRDAPAPAVTVDHLSGTPAGIVHALRLADPHGLVRAIRLTRGGASATLAADDPAALAGYLALPRTASMDDTCRLALVFHSGRVLPVGDEGPLAPFDGSAPAVAGAAAVAAARLDRERGGRVLRTEDFGAGGFSTGETARLLSIVTAFDPACPDLVATRAVLVLAEPGGGAVEIVCTASEGETAAAARTALARAAATFGIAHRLVTVTPDLDPAARIVAGVAAARAAGALVLDADVLPAEPGWLAPWRRLSARHPMLRAAVAGHDGRAEAGGAGCFGLLRAATGGLLATATPYGAPSVLAAELADRLATGGTPEARLGLVFRRYGETRQIAFEKSVDEAALALVLKRTFTSGCDEGRP